MQLFQYIKLAKGVLRMEYLRNEIGGIEYLSSKILSIVIDFSICFIKFEKDNFVYFD